MKKSTDELLHILKSSSSVSTYLDNEEEQLTTCNLAQYLEEIVSAKNLSKSECIAASGLDRTYGYQIFSGIKNPSRDKLLALCFGMHLSLDEVQQLLKCTGYPPLYPRIQKDSVILFCLNRNLSLTETNDLLFKMHLDLLI